MGTVKFNMIVHEYMEQFILASKRKALYFTRMDNIPAKYQNDAFVWVFYNKPVKGNKNNQVEFLVEKATGERVIKNSKVAGKPRMSEISGQRLWSSGQGEEYKIREMKEQLTAYLVPFMMRQLPPKLFAPAGHFIHLELIFYLNLFEKMEKAQDIDNISTVYIKCVQDGLVLAGKIPKDDFTIMRGGYGRYVNELDAKERRLEIRIHFCKNTESINSV